MADEADMGGASGTTVTLRPARCSDAEQCCALIYAPGPPLWDFVFDGTNPIGAIARLFADGKGPYGWRTCSVAEVDGEVAGVVMWHAQANQRRLNLELTLQMLRLRGIQHRMRAMRRGRQVRSVMPPIEAGEGYVSCLATHASRRGEGIGTALLNEAARLALARGCETLVLDVSSENDRARRLYERLGFRVTAEHRFKEPQKAGIPSHLRMKRTLFP